MTEQNILVALAFLILTVVGLQKHSVSSQPVVDCGHPMPPIDGSLGDNQNTTEGSNVTYQCVQGFVPSTIFTASCIEQGLWFPSPDEHICMETEATVDVSFLGRTGSLSGIDCPGDSKTYSCSVQSNSEDLHLTWRIFTPGHTPVTVTYNKSSLIGNEVAIDAGFTSVLDNFTVESEFVQSSVVLTLLRDVSMDGTRLECSIAGLASDEIDVLFNNAVPLTPTGFSITREYHRQLNSTVTLSWSPGQDAGVVIIVYFYSVSISPAPLSHPVSNVVSSLPWNVTLEHNVAYSVSITAENCAGESLALLRNNVKYINCGRPTPPLNGELGIHSSTLEGVAVTFKCYRGSTTMTTHCTSEGIWSPDPKEHCQDSINLRSMFSDLENPIIFTYALYVLMGLGLWIIAVGIIGMAVHSIYLAATKGKGKAVSNDERIKKSEEKRGGSKRGHASIQPQPESMDSLHI